MNHIEMLNKYLKYNSILNYWKTPWDDNTYFYLDKNDFVVYNSYLKCALRYHIPYFDIQSFKECFYFILSEYDKLDDYFVIENINNTFSRFDKKFIISRYRDLISDINFDIRPYFLHDLAFYIKYE